jgi:hypothetical protein
MTGNPFLVGNPFVPTALSEPAPEPLCKWGFEYVRARDEVVVVFPSGGELHAWVDAIDEEWIYLTQVGASKPTRVSVSSLKLKEHLINDGNSFTQSSEPPAHRIPVTSNPFMNS